MSSPILSRAADGRARDFEAIRRPNPSSALQPPLIAASPIPIGRAEIPGLSGDAAFRRALSQGAADAGLTFAAIRAVLTG